MNRLEEMRNLLQAVPLDQKSNWNKLGYALMAVGVIVFLGALLLGRAAFAWQGLLVSVIFFAGIVQGALMFSVIATVTDAFWLRPIKRISELVATFGLVTMVLFGVLFLGGKYFFEWYDHDLVIHTKEFWLNYNFFIIRQILGILLMAVLSFFYLRNSIRPDFGLAKKLGIGFEGKIADSWLKDYTDQEEETKAAYHRNKLLAPWVGAVSFVIISFVAFDWMMSIDQEWFSTMFGVQYFIACMIGGGALLMFASGWLNKNKTISAYQTKYRHHDLSKLVFAFTMLWTYMIFAQFLVIWYANLPEETPFLILRMNSVEWGWMFKVIFVMLFFIPFFGLMSRTACRSFFFSRIIAFVLLVGLWLEKYFIIAPSMQENSLSHFNDQALASTADLVNTGATIQGFEPINFLINALITLGVLGGFIVWLKYVIRKFPLMAISDNRLFKPEH